MNSPARCWAPAFSPQSTFAEVSPLAVQEQFRQQFTRWGLPARLRFDNGHPWGNWNDLPTALALWLIGLGIDVLWNEARHPEQHGKVERSQGTGQRWTEPHQCATDLDLQARFETMDQIQRARYPAIDGRSRLEAFPELAHSGRPYTRAWERRSWELARVTAHLAHYLAVRRVSGSGHVSVYDTGYYVGVAYRGQRVHVSLDPSAVEWVITDDQGRQLRRHPARQITRDRIVKLNLKETDRKPTHGPSPRKT